MLLSNFNLLATAPGGVARLRELIMTLAVQGKLVSQDPLDEPADVLLQKIRAEKDRLIAEGKIKRDKPVLPIAEQEKSFGLPAGWEWVRVGQIASRVQYGFTASADHSITQPKLLRITDIQNDQVNWDTVPGVKVGSQDVSGYFLADGDLLIARTGGTIGKSFLVDVVPVDSVFASYLIRISPLSGLTPQYLKTFASSGHYWNQVLAQSMGTGQPNINGTALSALVLALPPLAEQSRIVTRVEELMHVCDALEVKGKLEAAQHAQLVSTLLGTLTDSDTPEALAQNWQRIAAHFDLLLDRPQAIDAFEQTILQLAVRGLLVPQDPRDDPASILLQKIRAEKDRLILEGKIKRDKPLPPIAEDEKPFALPQGWEWMRFGDVALISSGITLGRKTAIPLPVFLPYLRVANVQRWHLNMVSIKEVVIDQTELDRFQLLNGDLLITEGGDWDKVGRTAIWRDELAICLHQNHVFKARGTSSDWNPVWAEMYLNSMIARTYFASSAKQTTNLASINMTQLKNCMFPLPPLAEQSRIVARVEELRCLCAGLRQRLSASQTTQAHLAEALVELVAG